MPLPGQVFSPAACKQCGIEFDRTNATHRYCRPCGIERAALLQEVQRCRGYLYRQVRRKADPTRTAAEYRRDDLSRKYRLTPAQYDAMVAAQQGVCAICHKTCPTDRRLAVDADHTTHPPRVRGLLCSLCNRGIGMLQHSPELLRAAQRYLEA